MKRNYYTIHKNKKPKRLRERKTDPFSAITAITGFMGAAQIQSIRQSEPDIDAVLSNISVSDDYKLIIKMSLYNMANEKKSKALKELMMMESVLSTAKAITVKIPKDKMMHNFKTTGRYVK